MKRWKVWTPLVALCLGVGLVSLAGALKSPSVAAEPKATATEEHPSGSISLAYPTGDRATSVLFIETTGPKRVRVGETFTYRIKVTNLTKHLVLEHVLVSHRLPKELEILSVNPEGSRGRDGDDKGEKTQPKGQGAQVKSNAQDRESKNQWLIGRLMPGESKTMAMQGLGHKEGTFSACLGVSYNPILCLSMEFVKPELQLTKQAPKETDFCHPFRYRYTVRNTGSAAATGVKIRDELPKGLSVDGKQVVQFDVGRLEPGKERTFTAEVLADNARSYSSRAVATADHDIRVQSRRTTTTVQQVDLTAKIDGPDSTYVNQPMVYKVTVSNRGDAPALDTQLGLNVSNLGRVVRATQEGKDGGKLRWSLGRIDPGKSKQVRVTLLASEKGDVKVLAEALSACARKYKGVLARSTTETKVEVIPALLLTVGDEKDPVRVGNMDIYNISVFNQGSGADHDVKIKVDLPSEMKYVDSTGPTKSSANGQTVSFEPLKQLAPGQRVEWKLKVKADKEADVRTRVELSSDYLEKAVPDVEPTRIVK